MALVVLATWLTAVASAAAPQLSPPRAEWAQADRAVRRLDPSEFSELPPVLQRELQRRGCSVPQPFTGSGRQNVIRGTFTKPGQIDWAVLCSCQRTSRILVFRGGGLRQVDELGPRSDSEFLQVVGPDQIGFSRALAVASVEYIREHSTQYGGSEPFVLTHAGINDAFVEKASIVWYWHQGKWLQLAGAD